jgi:hypothetical protein
MTMIKTMTPNTVPWNILSVKEKHVENHESTFSSNIEAFIEKSILLGALPATTLYSSR